MPFQAIEMNEVRSVWVESPLPELGMGFLKSTRVEILLNPDGVSDWSEPGTAYKAVLMAGLWPDDHELALMVLGYVPGSSEAADFLTSLVDTTDDLVYDLNDAYIQLLKGVQIMPVWGAGQRERMLFVLKAFASGTSKDNAPNMQRTGTQVRSASQMGFEQWKLMLDLALTKAGTSMSDILIDDDWITDDDLHGWHDNNINVEGTVIEIARRIKGSESVDANENDDA